MQTKFKLGDMVRAVKVCSKDDFLAEGASNCWLGDMTKYVDKKATGVVTKIMKYGIYFTGDTEIYAWPSAALEFVDAGLDFNKPIQTKSGKPVEVITTNARNEVYKVIGYMGDNTETEDWTINGKFYSDNEESTFDLINVPEKSEVQEFYINVYANALTEDIVNSTVFYKTRAEAAHGAYSSQFKRIACKKITFTKGEFDD